MIGLGANLRTKPCVMSLLCGSHERGLPSLSDLISGLPCRGAGRWFSEPWRSGSRTRRRSMVRWRGIWKALLPYCVCHCDVLLGEKRGSREGMSFLASERLYFGDASWACTYIPRSFGKLALCLRRLSEREIYSKIVNYTSTSTYYADTHF
jgi:hypothetical protein